MNRTMADGGLPMCWRFQAMRFLAATAILVRFSCIIRARNSKHKRAALPCGRKLICFLRTGFASSRVRSRHAIQSGAHVSAYKIAVCNLYSPHAMRRFYWSLKHAMRGLHVAFVSGRNLRIQLSVAVLVLVLAILFAVKPWEFILLLLLCVAILTLELFNSVVERSGRLESATQADGS